MKREIHYQWRLRELMARNHIRSIGELMEPLRERGITLSLSQVTRLASDDNERISFPVLVALCDILGVEANELITYTATAAATRRRKVAAGDHSAKLPDLRDYQVTKVKLVDDDRG
jgi:DNA-binding Xre family transcriptional regulator